MEWQQKIDMCELGQQDDLGPFIAHVRQHLDIFDIQAWDMLLTLVTLTEEAIKKHIDFFAEILPRLEGIDMSCLDLRSRFRLAILIEHINELSP